MRDVLETGNRTHSGGAFPSRLQESMSVGLTVLLGYLGVGVVAIAQSLVRDFLRGDFRRVDVERVALWVGAVFLWPCLIVGELCGICLARRIEHDKKNERP